MGIDIPAAKQLATIKPDTKEQEKAAAIAALKIIQGTADTLNLNREAKEAIKTVKHQLEALQPA
jgi:hypothetical protein